MSCPSCGNSEVELECKRTDGQGYYEKEEYSCPKCGCEWEWEMKKTITKQGREEGEDES